MEGAVMPSIVRGSLAGGRAEEQHLPASIKFAAGDRVAAEARYETDRVAVALVGAGFGRRAVRSAFDLSPAQLRAAERRATRRGGSVHV
jgi:hypothetical protein